MLCACLSSPHYTTAVSPGLPGDKVGYYCTLVHTVFTFSKSQRVPYGCMAANIPNIPETEFHSPRSLRPKQHHKGTTACLVCLRVLLIQYLLLIALCFCFYYSPVFQVVFCLTPSRRVEEGLELTVRELHHRSFCRYSGRCQAPCRSTADTGRCYLSQGFTPGHG